jgi:hypothetical protein
MRKPKPGRTNSLASITGNFLPTSSDHAELDRLEKLLKELDTSPFEAKIITEGGLVLALLHYSPHRFYVETRQDDRGGDSSETEINYDNDYNVLSARKRYNPNVYKTLGEWKDVTFEYQSRISVEDFPQPLGTDPRYIFRKGKLLTVNGRFYSIYRMQGILAPEFCGIALEVTNGQITGMQSALQTEVTSFDGWRPTFDVAAITGILRFEPEDGASFTYHTY